MITDYIIGLPLRLLAGFVNFIYFWYVKSTKDFWRKEIGFIKGVEREIGIFINLKLITQPIFGDYSFMGKIIGPIFRLCRVLIGCFFVLLSVVTIVFLYVLWLLFPLVAIFMTLKNLFYLLFL